MMSEDKPTVFVYLIISKLFLCQCCALVVCLSTSLTYVLTILFTGVLEAMLIDILLHTENEAKHSWRLSHRFLLLLLLYKLVWLQNFNFCSSHDLAPTFGSYSSYILCHSTITLVSSLRKGMEFILAQMNMIYPDHLSCVNLLKSINIKAKHIWGESWLTYLFIILHLDGSVT